MLNYHGVWATRIGQSITNIALPEVRVPRERHVLLQGHLEGKRIGGKRAVEHVIFRGINIHIEIGTPRHFEALLGWQDANPRLSELEFAVRLYLALRQPITLGLRLESFHHHRYPFHAPQ